MLDLPMECREAELLMYMYSVCVHSLLSETPSHARLAGFVSFLSGSQYFILKTPAK